uniref:Glyoxylate reductase/hydroxypyruvate reductase n=1 Tax=Megaselia scalaris TaxID=36166 RepID=T1GMG2_MEGSC
KFQKVVVCNNIPPTREDTLQKIQGVDGVLWAHTDKVNGEVLDAAGKQLKVISTMTSGIDYVEIPTVKERGVLLGNTPGAVNVCVAELAIGLMLAAGRRFQHGRRIIETSTWETNHIDWMYGQEIRGSVVGFFGFGGIGQAVAERLKPFGVKKMITIQEGSFQMKTNLEQVIESDFIVVASPLTEQTREIFNEAAFNKMKKNCVFVNVGRGQIVEQNSLIKALKEGKIFSAGLDVMTPEPLPASHELMTLENCVVIPHLGTATLQTTTDMALIAAQNILNGLEGIPLPAGV